MSFNEWLRWVDAELEEKCGMNSGDVGDCVDFKRLYREGYWPGEAARLAMAEWGFFDNPLVV